MNEWQLLVESEGISKGDIVLAEDQNTGEVFKMKFLKATRGLVYFFCAARATNYTFSAETLESYGENDLIIIGV